MNKINEYLGGRVLNTTSLNNEDLNELQTLGGKLCDATFRKDNKLFCRR